MHSFSLFHWPRRGGMLFALIGSAFASMTVSAGVVAQSAAGVAKEVTFTRDIAPILQDNCEICHRPGSIAPMALRTYEEVRPWAQIVRLKVESRVMPPWHLDPSVGIQEFKNDISLSAEQIAMIGQWVDAGTPLGNLADMPTPLEWPDYSSTWRLESEFGLPDIVLTTEDYTVPANGLDQWFNSEIDVPGVTEERWIRAIEIRPSNPAASYVFHHGNSTLVQGPEQERASLLGAAVGMYADIFPEDAGKRLLPGATLETEIHYFPIGEEIEHATMDLGIYLYPPGETPRFETRGALNHWVDATQTTARGPLRKQGMPEIGGVRAVDLFIPPHGTQMLRGIYTVEQPTRMHSIRGHMHLRGKAQSLEAIYPDGRHEIINKIDWHHNWHTTFIYEDWTAPLFPKGTVLIMTSWFDNTADNQYNPDPDQVVVFGRRSVDEMSHLWLGMTYFTDEEFEQVVAEREAILAARAAGGE